MTHGIHMSSSILLPYTHVGGKGRAWGRLVRAREGWTSVGRADTGGEGGHRCPQSAAPKEGRTSAGRSGLGKAGQRWEPPVAMERAPLPGLAAWGAFAGEEAALGEKHIWVTQSRGQHEWEVGGEKKETSKSRGFRSI